MSFKATVESMSKIMDDTGIMEIELERQFLFGIYKKHIHLSKSKSTTIAMPEFKSTTNFNNNEKDKKTESVSGTILKSPMVGVAYLSPEPNSKPFTTIGAKVKAGDTLILIEAMKTFNPVKSEKDGTIKEILVTDNQAVEYDQPLIVIE